MSTLLIVATVMSVAGLAFFTMTALLYWARWQGTMTRSDRAEAEATETRKRRDRGGRDQQARRWLIRQGYDGDPMPMLLGTGALYLASAAVLRLIGLPVLYAVIIALPAAAVVSWLVLRNLALRRRRDFNRQLIDYLRAVASFVESGNGIDSAMRMAAYSAEEPLRNEMETVLNSQSKDLEEPLQTLAERYPSRALELFTAALRLDRRQSGGAPMAPILREAADLMQRDRDLSSEAVAELSQTKGEFYAIVATIGLICVTLFTSSDGPTRQALLSPVGLAVIGLFAANFVWGIYRALKKFSYARGEVG